MRVSFAVHTYSLLVTVSLCVYVCLCEFVRVRSVFCVQMRLFFHIMVCWIQTLIFHFLCRSLL